MMAMAAGLAGCGKIPVVNTFGSFHGAAWNGSARISLSRMNVKIIGSHTGLAWASTG